MTTFQALAPRIRRVWRVTAGLVVVPVIAALGGVSAVVGRWWAWSTVGWVAVLLAAAAWKLPAASYRRWSYALRAHDLVVRHGIFTRTEQLIPRTRIQHVYLVEGVLDRWMGLAKLRIFTAGTLVAAVAIPGLERAKAVDLRDDLLSWVLARSDPPLESSEAPPSNHVPIPPE